MQVANRRYPQLSAVPHSPQSFAIRFLFLIRNKSHFKRAPHTIFTPPPSSLISCIRFKPPIKLQPRTCLRLRLRYLRRLLLLQLVPHISCPEFMDGQPAVGSWHFRVARGERSVVETDHHWGWRVEDGPGLDVVAQVVVFGRAAVGREKKGIQWGLWLLMKMKQIWLWNFIWFN